MNEKISEGMGCFLQGLAAALVLIGFGIADALMDGRIP